MATEIDKIGPDGSVVSEDPSVHGADTESVLAMLGYTAEEIHHITGG